MKLAPNQRKELVSATITQTLGLIMALSGLVVVTSFAADPSWWSTPGPGSTPSAVMAKQVVTNNGVVSTNYVPNPYAVVTQGQLKQFTTRAVNYLNGTLPGGAGTNLNTMVSNWAEDYATNGYVTNTANPTRPYKPSDLQAENVGQLKYIASLIYTQLANVGYTGLYPSWIMQNTNTDSAVANLGQLKKVFDFDLSVAPASITGLTASTSNPDEIDLSWTLPAMNNATTITVLQSTDGGATWTPIAMLAPNVLSYAAINLNPSQTYIYSLSSSNSNGSTTSGSSSPKQPLSPAISHYAVVDLTSYELPETGDVFFGTNPQITDSGNVLLSLGITSPTTSTLAGWTWTNGVLQPINIAGSGAGSIYYINEPGTVLGRVFNSSNIYNGSQGAIWSAGNPTPTLVSSFYAGLIDPQIYPRALLIFS